MQPSSHNRQSSSALAAAEEQRPVDQHSRLHEDGSYFPDTDVDNHLDDSHPQSVHLSASDGRGLVERLEHERHALELRAAELRLEREARHKKITKIAKEIEQLEMEELQRRQNRKLSAQNAERGVSAAEKSKQMGHEMEQKAVEPGAHPEEQGPHHKTTQTSSAQEDAAKELSHTKLENAKLRQMVEDLKKSQLLQDNQLQNSTDEKMNLIRAHEEVWKLAKNLQTQLRLTQEENERLKKKLAEQPVPPKYGVSAEKYKGNQDRKWGDSGLYGSTAQSQSREMDLRASESNIKPPMQGWRSDYALADDFLYLPAIKSKQKAAKDNGSQISPSKAGVGNQNSPMRTTIKSVGGVTHSTHKNSKDKQNQEATYKANLAKVQSPAGLEGYKLWLLDTKEMDFLKDPKTLKKQKAARVK